MAKFDFSKKAAAKKTPDINELPDNCELKVESVKVWNNGITFNLVIDSIVRIFGCRVVQKKDGEAFVSFPSRKGSDGKYYNHVYLRLSPEQEEWVLEQVCDAMEDD